jgi:hypothetical protein
LQRELTGEDGDGDDDDDVLAASLVGFQEVPVSFANWCLTPAPPAPTARGLSGPGASSGGRSESGFGEAALVTEVEHGTSDDARYEHWLRSTQRKPQAYNLANEVGHVVQFVLLQEAYRPGDVIAGVFDFSRSVVPCVQVCVALELEEKSVALAAGHPSRLMQVKAADSHHDYTAGCLQSHLNLRIPSDLPAAFCTRMIEVSWSLRFEFVTPLRAETGEVEVLNWKIPLSVRNDDHGDSTATTLPTSWHAVTRTVFK